MRLENKKIESSPALPSERNLPRVFPHFKESPALAIGSGDRCLRVPGSCFSRSDPRIASWVSAQSQMKVAKADIGSDFARLCLLGFILWFAAAICWFFLGELESYLRRVGGILTPSPQRVRFFMFITVTVLLGLLVPDSLGLQALTTVCYLR